MNVTNIKIGTYPWEVHLADPHDPLLIVDGGPCMGATWCGHRKIALSNELTIDSAYSTIVHELTHAYLYSTQLETPEQFNEEQVCQFFERWGKEIIAQAENLYSILYLSRCHTGKELKDAVGPNV